MATFTRGNIGKYSLHGASGFLEGCDAMTSFLHHIENLEAQMRSI